MDEYFCSSSGPVAYCNHGCFQAFHRGAKRGITVAQIRRALLDDNIRELLDGPIMRTNKGAGKGKGKGRGGAAAAAAQQPTPAQYDATLYEAAPPPPYDPSAPQLPFHFDPNAPMGDLSALGGAEMPYGALPALPEIPGLQLPSPDLASFAASMPAGHLGAPMQLPGMQFPGAPFPGGSMPWGAMPLLPPAGLELPAPGMNMLASAAEAEAGRADLPPAGPHLPQPELPGYAGVKAEPQ